MNPSLTAIFELEDRQEFDHAFAAYTTLYAENQQYDVWKHFYFFLWASLEGPSDFQERIQLNQTMRNVLGEGQRRFAHTADFNFLAGYTISILPYEFGDYEEEDRKAQAMLRKATELEPFNSIYRLAYLGNYLTGSQHEEYEQALSASAPLVLEEFSGKGALNSYFRSVMYRPKQ